MDAMATAANDVRHADNPKRGSFRIGHLVVAASGMVLLIGVSGAFWCRSAPPEPPAVVLQDAEPVVAVAVEDAYRAVRASPRSAVAWGRLGMILLAHDFFCEANTCLCQAERLEPQEPRWPYYQGIALSLGYPEVAIPKLQRAADLCGDRVDAPRLRLAEALLGQGRVAEAAEQLNRVLQRDPGNARAHLGLAQLACDGDDLPSSLAHLQHCTDSPFTRKAALALLAEIEHRLGRKQAVLQHLHEAGNGAEDLAWPDPFVQEIDQVRKGKQACLARMERLVAQSRVPEAIQLLGTWVRGNPDSDWAWLWLGRLLIRQEDFVAAERALHEAARQAPESVETQFYLGVALYCRGRSDQAAPFFRRAAELKPDYALAHYNLGHCLLRSGDRAAALTAFREAVHCKANFADAHTNLGELLIENGEYAEGFVHLLHAFELNPQDSRVNKLLGRFFSACMMR
jgi:tetratricopeptide (TPR) repeat protein